jgi:hypothetical protein
MHQRAEEADLLGCDQFALADRTALDAFLIHVEALAAADPRLVLRATRGAAMRAAVQRGIAAQ